MVVTQGKQTWQAGVHTALNAKVEECFPRGKGREKEVQLQP